MPVLLKKGITGRVSGSQMESVCDDINLPKNMLREEVSGLPEVSELQVVRHFTKLSRKNFSIDTHFYPLGSCTMKYNPRGVQQVAMLEGFRLQHPHAPNECQQGLLRSLYEFQGLLQRVTGMEAVSLSPMAGAQGELAGVAMIKAYHESNGDYQRNEVIVPDSAHGTNPATAAMAGYSLVEIETDKYGDVSIPALKEALSEKNCMLYAD